MHKNSIELTQLNWRSIQNRVAYGLCLITGSVDLWADLRLASVEACAKEPYTRREHNLTGRSAVW
jgi:hypothetical protein